MRATGGISHWQISDLLLPNLIRSIGDDEFAGRLLVFLQNICGAAHCAVVKLEAGAMAGIAQASMGNRTAAQRQFKLYRDEWWRRDPMIEMTQQELCKRPTSIVRATISEMEEEEFAGRVYVPTHICDRILICGRSEHGILGISVLRTDRSGLFSPDDMARIQENASNLLAVSGKHSEVRLKQADNVNALTSFPQIEACVNATGLPRREAEVCARILYGLSTTGIALDLGIGEETVTTYRKRAYQRLGIASRRELLVWYLDFWNARRWNSPASVLQ